MDGSNGKNIYDKDSRFVYNKMYYKNAAYVFSVNEIKTFAAKFAVLYADLLRVVYMFNPSKYRLSEEQLLSYARFLSE